MILNSTTIQALRRSHSTIFRDAYGAAEKFAPKLATFLPVNTDTVTYSWTDPLTGMREWIGPREVDSLVTKDFTLVCKPFEKTLGVKAVDVATDNLGLLTPRLQFMAEACAYHPDEMIVAALQNGTSNTTWDGVPFFSASHPLNPAGNQANNFTGTALSATNFETVLAVMQSYTGPTGKPLGLGNRPTLIVPPALRGEAQRIVKAATQANGATNVNEGAADLLVLPQLANQATTWYLADLSRSMKPFLFQYLKVGKYDLPNKIIIKDGPTDDNVWERDQYLYGADCRSTYGYGMWFQCIRCIA